MYQPEPLKTFIIYARSDEAYKQQLLLHLRPLRNSGLLSVWHDGDILPGEDWERAIKKELKSSDLVLVLVSANSLNSEFIQGQELRTALDRLREGLARVVPVIVSPCGWHFDPVLSGLQALPLFGGEGPKPVNDRVWQNSDEAWANVVDNLGNMALELNEQRRRALAAEKEAEQRKVEAEKEKERLAASSTIKAEAHRKKIAEAQERKEAENKRAQELKAKKAKEIAAKKAKETEAARRRNKQERATVELPDRDDQNPVPWLRWVAIGVVFLLLIFLIRWVTGCGVPGLNSSKIQVLNPEAYDTLVSVDADRNKGQKGEGATSISSEKLPINIGVKIDEPINTDFSFDYKIVRVAGGTYTMGTPLAKIYPTRDDGQHQVVVRSFGIGQTEVTQAQWKSVMGTNPSTFKDDNLPVETVSWYDVQLFIKKLNEKTGKHYRLPTEEEWEYAARGGNFTKNTLYSGSKNLGTVAWYRANSGQKTHAVGTMKANELGLFDMSGNVCEWCQDLYGPYQGANPRKHVSTRVKRGGSWDSDDYYCQVFVRSSYILMEGLDDIGFRLAQD